jgi:hypothetical protein
MGIKSPGRICREEDEQSRRRRKTNRGRAMLLCFCEVYPVVTNRVGRGGHVYEVTWLHGRPGKWDHLFRKRRCVCGLDHGNQSISIYYFCIL